MLIKTLLLLTIIRYKRKHLS